MSRVFQTTAVASSNFAYRFAAAPRRRTTAKGDSTSFAVPLMLPVGLREVTKNPDLAENRPKPRTVVVAEL